MATSIIANPRLKEGIKDEPKQALQPISGYEDEPLLPLEEACRPLEKIIAKDLQQKHHDRKNELHRTRRWTQSRWIRFYSFIYYGMECAWK